ncbi:MAG: TonB-dependent receptor [Chitinophagales bacterium]
MDSVQLHEFVYTGSLKEMRKDEFAIPVEVFRSDYFSRNNINNLHDAVQLISGIQPNIDGAIDGSSDIEMNGMEGHYTLILIDNNPISGGNASFYGLSGIPISIIDRIEVIKGPASTIYGSDAMAGVINVITKNPERVARFSLEEKITSYLENNAELSFRVQEKKASGLFSASSFNQNNSWDNDHDGFMDIPKINRFSLFSKWTFLNKFQKRSSVYARFLHEDRLGGELDFKPKYEGTDYIYGEHIRTNRFEVFGNFLLPVKIDNLLLQLAFTNHTQKAFYGLVPFNNEERNARIQLSWNNKIAGKSDLLVGAVYKYKWYDDNLPATSDTGIGWQRSRPIMNHMPALFIQDMIVFDNQNELLAGLRYEYNSLYKGNAIIPRIDYKFSSSNRMHFFRIGLGSGFRIPNIFMDDRLAFVSGKRIIAGTDLKTELAYGSTMAYQARIQKSITAIIDVKPFVTVVVNKIEADYTSAPDAVVYRNDGTLGLNYGINLSADLQFQFPLKLYAAATILQNKERQTDNNQSEWEDALNSPVFNATYTVSYTWKRTNLSVDWNGVINSPMRMVTVVNDLRPSYSPWFCIMNLQLSKRFKFGLEIFAGINNLLNVKPKQTILRPNDPFNSFVNDLDSDPRHFRFNASYIYAPNQGIKGFFGIRYILK